MYVFYLYLLSNIFGFGYEFETVFAGFAGDETHVLLGGKFENIFAF